MKEVNVGGRETFIVEFTGRVSIASRAGYFVVDEFISRGCDYGEEDGPFDLSCWRKMREV